MRILYLLNTYPRPSHSFVRREIRALERQGHEVLRVAMRPPPERLADPADREEAAQTRYVLGPGAAWRLAGAVLRQGVRAPGRLVAAGRLAFRAWRAAGRGAARHLVYLAEACHVAALCRAEDVRHLHAHFGTNPATVAMLVRALGGPRFSFTVHGPEEFDRPEALMLGEKVARAAFAVTVSSFGRSQLCRWAAPADWAKIHVVHCGIEPGAFPAVADLPYGPPRVVAIGRMAEQKGHLVLIEALARLQARGTELRLVLVGDGEMRGTVENAIRAHGLEGRVELPGWLDEAGVRAALDGAHALVLPSFAEGLPMVVMEAMAAGRPVIATWIAGIPELVQDGETGWLVPAGDAGALADALAELAATPAAGLRAMGKAGRARALARHDADAEAAKLAGHIAAALPPADPAGGAAPDPGGKRDGGIDGKTRRIAKRA